MVSGPGTKNKQLYSFYVKSMKSDSSGVAPLKRDGVSYSKAQDKAEILNSQLSSDYPRKKISPSISDLDPGISATVPSLHIEENGVRKILESLNPHQATGPDQISSRFLKEISAPLQLSVAGVGVVFGRKLDRPWLSPSDTAQGHVRVH